MPEITSKKSDLLKGDYIFRLCTLLFASVIRVILVVIVWQMTKESLPAIRKFRWDFLVSSDWNPVDGKFGALPYIYGSVVSSILAIIIATPLGVATALFITEISSRRIGRVISSLVELLAAIPSVIYGLWGIFVMAPWLQQTVQPWLSDHLGSIPFFAGAPYGVSMMAGALILSIMILPIIAAISWEVILAVPQSQREAAIALGATKWEMIRISVLPYAKSGILGAVILGLGRAIGETMAVTMVIGNNPQISFSLLAPAYTMPSVIANEFAEATSTLHYSALMEIGLLLLGITLLVNIFARLLIAGISRKQKGGAH
jgi:phosphate transport system permease protein